ncbi:MAG: cupin domain-containing protein [Gammaproteobacteria bacterium]|nr:cupin domain-containing protein [Gammaproteobacteria bacterium]
MLRAVDIAEELDKLVMLEGRSNETTPEEEDAAFATLAAYRDGGVFAGSFSGESPWERHRNGDELVHVLRGSTALTIMTETGPEVFALTEGMIIIVPQGHWHKFKSDEGVTVMTVTPQPTDHTTADDPCTVI